MTFLKNKQDKCRNVHSAIQRKHQKVKDDTKQHMKKLYLCIDNDPSFA